MFNEISASGLTCADETGAAIPLGRQLRHGSSTEQPRAKCNVAKVVSTGTRRQKVHISVRIWTPSATTRCIGFHPYCKMMRNVPIPAIGPRTSGD
jgi:hypothetical protein